MGEVKKGAEMDDDMRHEQLMGMLSALVTAINGAGEGLVFVGQQLPQIIPVGASARWHRDEPAPDLNDVQLQLDSIKEDLRGIRLRSVDSAKW
jgi:hypothetical protein